MKFRPTTAKTLVTDLQAFAAEIRRSKWPDDARQETATEFNRWMDQLLGQDAFGTEGQCDPRGDHRE
jgi:hypothetical protein